MPTSQTQATVHYKDEIVAKNYECARFSGMLGRLFNRLEQRAVKRGLAGLRPGLLIGDIPCGAGRMSAILLASGFRVVGVDVSEAMLALSRARFIDAGERFRSVLHDAGDLPASDLRFDAAICVRLLFHFPPHEQIRLLRGIASVTSERVIFMHGLDTPYHRVRRWVTRPLRRRPNARRPISPMELQQLLKESGLQWQRTIQVLPGLSEAVLVVATPVPVSG